MYTRIPGLTCLESLVVAGEHQSESGTIRLDSAGDRRAFCGACDNIEPHAVAAISGRGHTWHVRRPDVELYDLVAHRSDRGRVHAVVSRDQYSHSIHVVSRSGINSPAAIDVERTTPKSNVGSPGDSCSDRTDDLGTHSPARQAPNCSERSSRCREVRFSPTRSSTNSRSSY